MAINTIPTQITFFERFEADILSGKKTITIRDQSECNYVPGTSVKVSTFEDGREFCQLQVLAVQPIRFSELNQFHAEQENMTLMALKDVIQKIYPGIDQLYVVSYSLVN